jgi:hypothetical protein
MENLLLALREGGRLAAKSGERAENGNIAAGTAPSYTACAVETGNGCPKQAELESHGGNGDLRPECAQAVRFKGARLELFGYRAAAAARPGSCAPTGARSSGRAGARPVRFHAVQRRRDSAELLLAPRAEPRSDRHRLCLYRGAADDLGPVPRAHRKRRLPDHRLCHRQPPHRDFRERSHPRRTIFAATCSPMAASSSIPYWSVTGSVRRATDRTFLRRYDISRDDRLRSMIDIERIDANSYFSWPAGPPRRCASATAGAGAGGPADHRLSPPPDRSAAGRQDRAAGQLAGHPRTRGRTPSAPSPAPAGICAASPAGPGSDADRHGPRRRLSFRRERADRDGRSIAASRLAIARHRDAAST